VVVFISLVYNYSRAEPAMNSDALAWNSHILVVIMHLASINDSIEFTDLLTSSDVAAGQLC